MGGGEGVQGGARGGRGGAALSCFFFFLLCGGVGASTMVWMSSSGYNFSNYFVTIDKKTPHLQCSRVALSE